MHLLPRFLQVLKSQAEIAIFIISTPGSQAYELELNGTKVTLGGPAYR